MLTTENAARDMETIRVAIGGEPLNYLRYSYGAAIGSVYATLFPESVFDPGRFRSSYTQLIEARQSAVSIEPVILSRITP